MSITVIVVLTAPSLRRDYAFRCSSLRLTPAVARTYVVTFRRHNDDRPLVSSVTIIMEHHGDILGFNGVSESRRKRAPFAINTGSATNDPRPRGLAGSARGAWPRRSETARSFSEASSPNLRALTLNPGQWRVSRLRRRSLIKTGD